MQAGVRTAPEPVKPVPWVKLAWFGALLIVAYFPVLRRLAVFWYESADMGHGAFVPVVAGFIVWQRREALLATPAQPTWWGLVLIAWGGAQLYLATLGAELFLGRTAFILSLAGAVLLLGGWPILRRLAFPLALLFLMVPIPAIIFNPITFRLQLFASAVADNVLQFIGIPVLREGNILELANGQRLSVAEACSGIRSLLTLSFLALVYAYFFDKKVWMRVALLIATVPIAIAANAARVTATGIISNYDPELARGLFHLAEGWVVFMVALAMLVATHAILNRMWKLAHGRG